MIVKLSSLDPRHQRFLQAKSLVPVTGNSDLDISRDRNTITIKVGEQLVTTLIKIGSGVPAISQWGYFSKFCI